MILEICLSARLIDLKTRFRQVQIKAALAVNTELLLFYWELGTDIGAQQTHQRWGSGFLASQMLKDPYVFDFLSLTLEHSERELEKALIDHITQFLLELGAGFAYMGRQVSLQVGEREFFLDLLFYHARLHCYVVVELKTVDFEPEFASKLNFYLKAVDEQLRGERDAPTIGLLLCKS